MNLVLTEEQNDLQRVLRRFDRDRARELTREVQYGQRFAFDADRWAAMGEELGILGAALPESAGGGGGNLRDLVIIVEELGRSIDATPFMSSIIQAAGLLLATGDDKAASLVSQLAEGDRVATVIHGEASSSDVRARHLDETWSLHGLAKRVMHADAADFFVVLADTPRGPAVFNVSSDHVDITSLPVLDPSMPISSVCFRDTPGQPLGTVGRAADYLEAETPRWLITAAAYQLGNASAALDMAVDYAKSRFQFGRAIGSFQSVKHGLVDVMIAVESARAAVIHAASEFDEGMGDASILAHHCLAEAGEANMIAAKTCLQTLGAMGFTWEHPAHLLLKRSVSWRHHFGAPEVHREAVASRLLSP